MDALFSIAYKGARIITDVEKNKFASHAAKLDRLWKKCDLGFPVKLHVLVAHMPYYLGNGEQTEEFMEKQHQFAAAFDASSRVHGHTRKRKLEADLGAIRNNDEIKAVKEDILERNRCKKVHVSAAQKVRLSDLTERERDETLAMEELAGYRSWKAILKDNMRSLYFED